MFDCVEKKSELKYNSYYYDYNIKTSQNIERGIDEEADELNNYELSDNGKCIKDCKQCTEIIKCIKCRNNFSLLHIKANDSLICIPEDELINGYYKDSNSIYHECLENCLNCHNEVECDKCIDNLEFRNGECTSKNNNPDYNSDTNKDINIETNIGHNTDSDTTTDININSNIDINTFTNSDINSQTNTNTDININSNIDINTYINSDINAETYNYINSDINKDINSDTNTDINTDINFQTNYEMVIDTNTDKDTYIKIIEQNNTNSDNKKFISNNDSTKGISIGVLVGIIAGAIIVIVAIILVIINRKKFLCNKEEKIIRKNEIDKDRSIYKIIDTTNMFQVKFEICNALPKTLTIEGEETVSNLIKEYFNIIKKPELFNRNDSIFFFI